MIVCPFKDLSRYAAVIPGLEEAVAAIKNMSDLEPHTVPLSGNNRIIVQDYNTKPAAQGRSESHRRFLDVQYIVEGEECVGWADVATLTPDGDFNDSDDIGFYTGHVDLMRIPAGYCYVVFPEDAHMPGIAVGEPAPCKKMVVKLAV
ncbi:MAG: YhcH/YjgK/YiaL family protein [Faecousia sp.]